MEKEQNRFVAKFMICITAIFLTGCATVQLASQEDQEVSKTFQPVNGKSGLYVFREGGLIGAAVTHPVFLDGQLLGSNAPDTYLYAAVNPGPHTITAGTTSVSINAEAGGNYFVRQKADMTGSGTMMTSSVSLETASVAMPLIQGMHESASALPQSQSQKPLTTQSAPRD